MPALDSTLFLFSSLLFIRFKSREPNDPSNLSSLNYVLLSQSSSWLVFYLLIQNLRPANLKVVEMVHPLSILSGFLMNKSHFVAISTLRSLAWKKIQFSELLVMIF